LVSSWKVVKCCGILSADRRPVEGARAGFGEISEFRRDFWPVVAHDVATMKKPKRPRRVGKRRAEPRRDTEEPALPYARAFMVQFSADTDARLKRVVGRIEHLQTGARRRFASISDLHRCIAAMLVDGAAAPGGLPRSAPVEDRATPGIDVPSL